MKAEVHPRILDHINDFLSYKNSNGQMTSNQNRFFGVFMVRINFYSDPSIPTAGVNVTSGGGKLKRGMNFYYNPEFIDSLSKGGLNFLIYHELMHLLHGHPERTLENAHDHFTANIAQDLVINELIERDIAKGIDKTELEAIPMGVYFRDVEKELGIKYEGELVYEEVYDWLIANGAKDKLNIPAFLPGGKHEGFDVHMEDELEAEERKVIVDKALNEIRNMGHMTSEMEQIIGTLRSKSKDYLKSISSAMSEIKGMVKKNSYKRFNRKGIPFKKGTVKKGQSIVAILDTSGSMDGLLEKVLSYIFRDDYHIHLIPIDTEVKEHITLTSKKEFKKLNVKGGGGTVLQPAINYIHNHKELKKLNVVILTDGYCDSLDLSGIKKTLIISTDIKVKIKQGKAKQILVD
jgi:predicted metal-dependent peptidase